MDKVSVLMREVEAMPEEELDEVIDFVRFLKTKRSDALDAALLSESALAKDWLEFSEDKAWQDL